MTRAHQTLCSGFSLIEMIVAITVLAILSASAAVFLRGPISGYFDAERRADLAEAGGLAMARLTQEVARAVPNSVRITAVAGGGFYLEFLPVRSEGRYRHSGPGNALTAGVADNGFDVYGPAVQVNAGDVVVVDNNGAPNTENVWSGAAVSARADFPTPGLTSAISYPSHQFPRDAPEYRFQVAGPPVTYACLPNPANPTSGTLRRYSGYPIQPGQPVNAAAAPLAGAPENALLAEGLSACTATEVPGIFGGAQVVSFVLNFENAGDRLNLAHTVRVETLP